VVKATIDGLKSMRTIADVAALRGKTVSQLTGCVSSNTTSVVEKSVVDSQAGITEE
jgi:hypothetical protein